MCIRDRGSILWSFANGYDDSPVKLENTHAPIKSVGNSTTTVSYTHLDVYKRQLLLAVIFVFSVAGLLGYGIFYLCQNESSRNTQKELQDIRGESKKLFLLYHIFWDLLMNRDQRP